MDCQRVRTELGELVARQVTPSRSAALHVHIAECSACHAALQEEEALRMVSATSLTYNGPVYSYAALRARMASIEPLQEVLVLLPKLQKIGATPRFAVAMVLLVFFGGVTYATRHARGLHAVCKEPIMEQRFAIGREFPEIYKTLYVKPVQGESHRAA